MPAPAPARRRPEVAPADAGVSLIELLVASGISLMLMALMGTMFIQITKVNGESQETTKATGVAWTVTDTVTRAVRQAVRVPVSATATEGGVVAGSSSTTLIVDTAADATVAPKQAVIVPAQITFTVNAAGSLVEQRVPGVVAANLVSFPAGGAVSRVVNGPIVTTGTGADALFVYTDATGAQVQPALGGLTAAQATTVTAVTVNVTVATKLTSRIDPVKLTNKVTMPNIAIVNGGV